MKLEDIKGSLGDTLQRYWKPALAGAALGGTTAGYLSRNTGTPGEAPGTRRRRMLRNALAGVLLGGTAGLAIPAGASIAASPWTGRKPSAIANPVDTVIDTAGKNIAPTVVGGIGAAGILKSLKGNKEQGFTNLLQNLRMHDTAHGEAGALREALKSPESFRAAMGGQHDIGSKAHALLTKGMGGAAAPALRATEQMTEAGFPHRGNLLELWKKMRTPGTDWSATRELVQAEGGPLSSRLAGLSAKPGLLGHAAGVGTEALRQLQRPSIKGRVGLPAKVMGLAAAAYLAKKLQNKALGE